MTRPYTTTCDRCTAPVHDNGRLCGHCTSHINTNLTTIATHAGPATQLAYNLARHGTPQPATGKPQSRPPHNLETSERLDTLTDVITRWCQHIATERTGTAHVPMHTHVGDPLRSSARWLETQVSWMRHRAEAVEFADDIQHIAATLQRITNGPTEHRYLGPCNAPDTRPINATCAGDVYAKPQDTHGQCRTCGTRYPVAERRAWLDTIVRDHLFTVAEIADAYGIRRNTINQWISRGRLQPHGYRARTIDGDRPDPRERPLYRVGDVLDLYNATRGRATYDDIARERQGNRITHETIDETRAFADDGRTRRAGLQPGGIINAAGLNNLDLHWRINTNPAATNAVNRAINEFMEQFRTAATTHPRTGLCPTCQHPNASHTTRPTDYNAGPTTATVRRCTVSNPPCDCTQIRPGDR